MYTLRNHIKTIRVYLCVNVHSQLTDVQRGFFRARFFFLSFYFRSYSQCIEFYIQTYTSFVCFLWVFLMSIRMMCHVPN